jgi:pimeloyl-ACP methyl ester carboxylesterase
MFVRIGGIEQWMRVSASAPERPILLFLHGGPGATTAAAAAAWQPWEEFFTVVHWDQRGASRTYARNGEAGCGPLSLERMVADGVEVLEFLTRELGASKVLLVGHSWGSALGVHLLKRCPDLISAFVGTGLLVHGRRNEAYNYTRQLRDAEAQGNAQALAALRALGVLRHWGDRLIGGEGDALGPEPNPRSEDFSKDEVPIMLAGMEYSRRELRPDLEALDLPALGLRFTVPMFGFKRIGRHGDRAPA